MPRIERRRVSRMNQESCWLNHYANNVRSQFGEDGIIDKIFSIIGSGSRLCVEFGAWDGEFLSNTWNLINNKGWSGVLIEGDSDRAAALAEKYIHNKNIVTIHSFVGWSGEQALDAILKKIKIMKNFELLSMDVDGNDWHIWEALKNYSPRVVIAEFNPTIPNDVYFVQDSDFSINQGCSLLALIELGKEKGYELIATTICNGIFIQKEFFPLFNIVDNSIDAMYDQALDIALFQGYDGTFFGAGHMCLNWRGIPIEQEDLQPLPKGMRNYKYE